MSIERSSPVISAFDPDAYDIGIESGTRTALRAKHASGKANILADLSALKRRLFVGRSVGSWLSAQGLDCTLGLFDVAELGGGAALARIHRDQYVLIDGLAAGPAASLFELDEGRHEDVLVLPYEVAEFACGGPDIGALMAELCPAPIDALPSTVWNATRLGHCDVVLRRTERPLHYRIACSLADARFLFGMLSEITRSRDGAVVGFQDYCEWLATEGGMPAGDEAYR